MKKPPIILLTQIVLVLCALGALSAVLAILTPVGGSPKLSLEAVLIVLFYSLTGATAVGVIALLNLRKKFSRSLTIAYLILALFIFPGLIHLAINWNVSPPLSTLPRGLLTANAFIEKIRFILLIVLAVSLMFSKRAKTFLSPNKLSEPTP